MFNTRIITLTAVLAACATAFVVTPAASAKGGDGVKVRGTCTQSSTAKLKLSREDRGVEVEFEVDQNRSGVPWKVTLRRNGTLVSATTATTRRPSGSFELHRVTPGASGKIVAVATRAGERCSAQAGIRDGSGR